MASIRKQKNTWFACLTLADGMRTERSTGIKDRGTPKERAENQKLAREIAVQLEETARGNKTESQIRKAMGDLFNRVSAKRIEFIETANFLGNWLARVKIRKSNGTWVRYKKIIDDFLAHLGKKAESPLSEVCAEDVQTYLDAQLAAGKKEKTARNEGKILNAPFRLAHRQGLILSNPVAAAEIPDAAGESKKPFTAQQVSDCIAVAKGDWKTVTLFAAYTGARLTDCANFAWANFDLVNKVLHYRPQKTSRHKKDIVCPLHRCLEAHLRAIAPKTVEPAVPVTPKLAGRYTGGRTGLSQQFEKILKQAGIENEPVVSGKGKGRAFKALGFHSFRPTFKTILVNAGVEVQTVDVLTGHAKKSVSEIYIHRSPELLRSAIAKLPDFMEIAA